MLAEETEIDGRYLKQAILCNFSLPLISKGVKLFKQLLKNYCCNKLKSIK